jgi:hypothetical protein
VASTTVLSACSSDDGPAPTTSSSTTTTTIPVAEPATLVDPGAEPRVELRTAYRAGDVVRIRTALDLVVDQEVDGRRQRLDSPPIVQTLEVRVLEADEDGALVASEVVAASIAPEGTDLDDEQALALADAIDDVVGLRTTVRIDDLGRAVETGVEVPDGLAPELRAQLDGVTAQLRQLTPALPAEPVGVGGSWRSTVTSAGDGQLPETTTTTTYVVVAIEGDRVTYEASITSTSPTQELDAATLRSSEGTGTATGWFDLAQPAFSVDARSTADQEVEVEADGALVQLDQVVTTVYRAEPEAG